MLNFAQEAENDTSHRLRCKLQSCIFLDSTFINHLISLISQAACTPYHTQPIPTPVPAQAIANIVVTMIENNTKDIHGSQPPPLTRPTMSKFLYRIAKPIVSDLINKKHLYSASADIKYIFIRKSTAYNVNRFVFDLPLCKLYLKQKTQ